MDIQTITAADIDRMQMADPRTANRSTLKDICDVNVDMGLPKKERMLDFIRQIGNPYYYRHGDFRNGVMRRVRRGNGKEDYAGRREKVCLLCVRST